MPSYAVPHSFPAVPDSFHAYLHAEARVQSSEIGSSVYLTLRGRHLVTLRLQTDPAGRPKEPLFLAGLSPLKKPVEGTSRVWWSAAGLVAAHPDELIVFSSTPRSTPLRICYRRHPDCTTLVERGQSVRVEGVLSAGRLTASAIQLLPPLVVPRRWAQWRRWL